MITAVVLKGEIPGLYGSFFVPFFWRNFLMENIISRELYSSQKR
ncbi:hypothetical protein ROSEINA2194_01560 [Roseburia inulinivorans DSM 16841]|uniref:Uncharacterized protein n=1 Tax=Roseburia inulinivorans DSM 16841 TaxID=622312 RepID=C0FS45_9FIRM|nr:hypothetical protein ROSEINA2194_01560 [Roseburia inulinivorans DSM 16841]